MLLSLKVIVFPVIFEYNCRFGATSVHINYRDKCEKRSCSASHTQCKTPFKPHSHLRIFVSKGLR